MHDSKLQELTELEQRLVDQGFTQNISHPAVWDNNAGLQVNTSKPEYCEMVLESMDND